MRVEDVPDVMFTKARLKTISTSLLFDCEVMVDSEVTSAVSKSVKLSLLCAHISHPDLYRTKPQKPHKLTRVISQPRAHEREGLLV